MNALDMLREDHKKVKGIFEQFENTEDPQQKKQLCQECIAELKIHTKLEEELIYPVMKEEGEELKELINEANEEHHVVDLIIAELEGMDPEEENFDAKFKVLSESVKHHIEEEEGETFPKAEEEGSADFEEIGEQMEIRKQELMEEGAGSSNGNRLRSGHNGHRASAGSNGHRAGSQTTATRKKVSSASRSRSKNRSRNRK